LNILMLSPTLPRPAHIGSRIRILHILEALSAAHRVTLIAPSVPGDLEPESSSTDGLEILPVPVASLKAWTALRSLVSNRPYRSAKFCSPSYRRLVSRLLASRAFDLVWVNYMEMMDGLPNRLAGGPPILLDQPNDELGMWRGLADKGPWAGRAFARRNLRLLTRLESDAFARLAGVIAVSDEEKASLERRLPGDCPVWKVPNGVDAGFFRPEPFGANARGGDVLFCGSLDVSMNADAAAYFARDIWPIVRRSTAGISFKIVGRKPPRRIRRLGGKDGIVVTGTVSDVRPFYREAAVAVAPFRIGAGTKLKVLESMAMGVPVVSTTVGARGIEAGDGEHFLIADDPGAFASRVLALLGDGRAAEALAGRARALAESRYDWKRVTAGLGSILEEASGKRGGSAQ
jgi:glycosyltransferase involved in cell wall biosynthesis